MKILIVTLVFLTGCGLSGVGLCAGCSAFAGATDGSDVDGSTATMNVVTTADAAVVVADASSQPEVDSGVDSGTEAGCTLYAHSAGPGDAGWTDCVPLGTYNQDQAMKACVAWATPRGYSCAVSTICSAPCPTGCIGDVVVHTATGAPRMWFWATSAGAISQYGSGTCYSDGSWN